MPRQEKLIPEFIELAPSELKEGVLYISMIYASVIHKCCCGCGEKVVTPLGPTDWKLTYDGESASLYPSVGNWSLPCQSHYWIRENNIEWAPKWSKEEIEAGRAADRSLKQQHFGAKSQPSITGHKIPVKKPQHGIWGTIRNWMGFK